jgi:hypothetical protein
MTAMSATTGDREPQLPRPAAQDAPASATGFEPLVPAALDGLRRDPSGLSAEEFPRLVRAIRWLSECGKPLRPPKPPATVNGEPSDADDPAEPPVEVLADWRDWDGFGKNVGVIRLYMKLKGWNEEADDAVESAPGTLGEALRRMREAVRERVGYVSPAFGADGPGASAVASRAIGMLQRVLVPVGVMSATGRAVPPKLLALWRWFARGRWPCSYWRPDLYGTTRLLVY